MRLELDLNDLASPTWHKLKAYIEHRIAADQSELERFTLSHEQSMAVRGRLFAYRQLLNKGDQPAAKDIK